MHSFAPGPGAYNIAGKPSGGPQYGFKGKPSDSASNSVPGPGQYSQTLTPQVSDRSPYYSFGRQSRSQQATRKSAPGPGMYNPSLSATAPLGSFGTAPRAVSERNGNPGPGAYEATTGKGHKTGAVLTSRHAQPANKTVVPGPGAYNLAGNRKGDREAYSMGKAERMAFRPATAPGPGAYDPKVNKPTTNSV